MAEILKDGNGVRRTFSDLAKAAVQLAEVASTCASLLVCFAAVFQKVLIRFRETCSDAANLQRCHDRCFRASQLREG